MSRKDQKIGSAISLFAGSLYLVLRQHLPVQTDSTHAVLVYEELSGRSSFDPWQPSECCLAHQATKKREIRMLRLVQKSSSTTTQILHNSALRGCLVCCEHPTTHTWEGNIYPPWRQFSPRLRARVYCSHEGGAVRCKTLLNPSDANSRRSRTSFVPGLGTAPGSRGFVLIWAPTQRCRKSTCRKERSLRAQA